MEIPTRHHWESDAARSDDVCEFGELAAKYGLTYGTPASTGKVAGPVGQRPVHRGSLSRSCSDDDDGSTGGVLTSSWPLAGWVVAVGVECVLAVGSHLAVHRGLVSTPFVVGCFGTACVPNCDSAWWATSSSAS